MRFMPLLQNLLCLPFRFSIMIERVFGMLLVWVLLVQSINSDGGKKHDAFHAILFHRTQCNFHSAYIGIVIKRCRRHIVAMLCRKQHHNIRSFKLLVHLLLLPDISNHCQVVEKMTRQQVDILQLIFFFAFLQQSQQTCPHKSTGSYHRNFHNTILSLQYF